MLQRHPTDTTPVSTYQERKREQEDAKAEPHVKIEVNK